MINSKGVGTRFLGLQKDDDGKLFATNWIVILFLPIFPLFSAYINIIKTGDVFNNYRVIEKTEHRFTNILKTYLYGWIIFPAFMFGPICFATPEFAASIGIKDIRHSSLFQTIVIIVVAWVAITGIILILWDMKRRKGGNEVSLPYKITG
ncbi:MAG: hypothetical protein EHM58_15990 [Ignavibacteriae bacterium]|nr:MAG: hypothetical protein EHM58_15990 [Ignavibacteriota bacterium]